MENLFRIAEEEMKELKHPYVGTEHFFLAFLKKYGNEYISYDEFKKIVYEIIGSSYKQSDYILYTPILRNIKNNDSDIKKAVLDILKNDDSIAYNLLLSKKYDVEKIYKSIMNANY